jgi:hypothetical protein
MQNLAYSTMWLCNRQGFLEKYYLKGGDFFKNPEGLTLQDYI